MNIIQDWDLLQEVNTDLESATHGELPSGPSHRARAVNYELSQLAEWPESFTRLIVRTFCDESFEQRLQKFLRLKGLKDSPEIMVPAKYEACLYQLRNARRLLTRRPQPIKVQFRNDRLIILPTDTDRLQQQARISPATGDKILRCAKDLLEDITIPSTEQQFRQQITRLVDQFMESPTTLSTDEGVPTTTPKDEQAPTTITKDEAEPAGRRRVRVGIIEKQSSRGVTDDDVLDIARPLRPATSYLLRVDISAKAGATNVVNDVAIDEQVLNEIGQGAELAVVASSSDVKIDQDKKYQARQAIHLLEPNASEFAFIRFTTSNRKGLVRIEVCVYYKNILLQHLVCEARVHDVHDKWNGGVSLKAWAKQGQARQQEAETLARTSKVRSVAELARKSKGEISKLAKLTGIEADTLESMRKDLQRLLGARTQADLKSGRRLRPLGNETTVVYSINPTFVAFDKYEDPALCITIGQDNLKLHVKAGEKDFHCDISPDLKESTNEFRNLMSSAVEPKPGENGFPNNKGTKDKIRKLLLPMAALGQDVFAATFNDPDTSDGVRNILQTPQIIATTQASPEQPIVPWNAIYDLELAENWEEEDGLVERDVCMKWMEQSHQKKPDFGQQLPDFDTCIRQTDCPRQRNPGESDDDYRRRARCMVCVFGFWGYKHEVQSPPGGLPQPTKPTAVQDALPAHIEVEHHPKVQVIANSTIYGAEGHRKRIAKLRRLPKKPDIHTAVKVKEIEASLRDKDSHVVYFLCHGGVSGHKHCVLVGDKNNVKISSTTLLNWKVDWPHAPLVVINGCETVGESEKAMANLALTFRARKASGIIGTETKVFSELARWFGENFMEQFLRGLRVGDVMLQLRLALLQKANPLGLIYTAYSMGGLRLVWPDRQDA